MHRRQPAQIEKYRVKPDNPPTSRLVADRQDRISLRHDRRRRLRARQERVVPIVGYRLPVDIERCRR